MAATLASASGAAFHEKDVIAYLQPVIDPEKAILNSYVFLPFARSGVSAALTNEFAWDAPVRAAVEMSVGVDDDRVPADPLTASITVHVFGPADVTELDARQVIRTYPKADAHNTEVDDLVQVEFDRPELPWLFTPTAPRAGRLVPWITLVVAEADKLVWARSRGATRTAAIRRDQLQPLGDAWAWAHAQVMGPKAPGPDNHDLEARLSERNAKFNLSRLLCPRRLAPGTSYIACVVPTFRAGNLAGLGVSPGDQLLPAWGEDPAFGAGDPMAMVDLAVYYTWSFSTGEDGNFESLARKVLPFPAPPGVGRRRVDATQPWLPAPIGLGDPGAEMVVNGPIVSLQQPEDAPAEHWPADADQVWPDAVTDDLRDRVNRPDEQAHQPVPDPPPADPPPPLVGPPLYGGHHAQQSRVETEEPAAGEQPAWFRELNLDPRDRMVAGVATRVIQAEQEDLMAEAWNQVGGVDAANRALRLAQLAKHVNASLHARHLAPLSEARLLGTTERIHAKVLDPTAGEARSVWAAVGASSLPPAVTTGAFRRLTRLRGPLARAARVEVQPLAVEALTVREDHLTTDWVFGYRSPDAVAALGPLARERVNAQIVDAVVPGVDPADVFARWNDALAAPGPEDAFTPESLDQGAYDTLDVRDLLFGGLLVQLLATMPTFRQMFADEDVAAAGAARAEHLRTLGGLAQQVGVSRIDVPLDDVKRLELPVTAETPDGRTAVVDTEAVRDFANRAMDLARQTRADLPFPEFERAAELLVRRLVESQRIEGGRLERGLRAIADKVITDDPYAEPDRSRLDVPALDLLGRLDPATTVPARVKARLTLGSGRLPSWVRPDWFDDGRIEPVMAFPRFAYPMYEPLDRYEREWMIPGLGLIQRPDMATLLETNSRFVEAYLVGLNHEMGRELLWREYPTDQRGTYFSSFWTGRPELAADLDDPRWRTGGLSDHVEPTLGKKIVFLVRGDLVRRYPGVVAHAVRQAQAGGDRQFVKGVPVLEEAGEKTPKETLFHIHLPPNILLVGFDLTEDEITDGDDRWWFTLSENPTEPRFGLDEGRDDSPPPAAPPSRDDLVWGDFGTAPGQFLDALSPHPAVRFATPVAGDFSSWGASSAEVAHLLFQLPARAAFLATNMLTGSRRH